MEAIMANIYLDSAAMYPVLPVAKAAYNKAPFGNPSSEHAAGHDAREALEQARQVVAAKLYAEPDEVYFFSTATEAAATVMQSAWLRGYVCNTSPFEHHAISENVYRPLNVDASPGQLVCQMHSNNETGVILLAPAKMMRKNDLWLCDATASVGHIPVSFKKLGCTYLLADGIKFGGVPGAAILIAKKDAPLYPIIRGGGQERGMRSGTENVPAICAMAAALEWQDEHMQENTLLIGAVRSILLKMLSEIPKHKWNTPTNKPCLPHILNISFDGVDAHALSLLLSNQGVMVSPGAACSNGLNEPSHVIMAMYGDEARARSAIRISFSHENTIDEAVEAGQKIKDAVAYLRSIA